MPRHDVECSLCHEVILDYTISPWPDLLLHEDGGELVILWHTDSPQCATVHPLDRVVVWRSPSGEVAYPPRNDSLMPSRYREAGYARVEMEHARDVEKFEKAHNVINEKLWYNSGNGAE